MLLREILTEQDQSKTVSTSDEKLLYRTLYHSTTYEKALKILKDNALQVNTTDFGQAIAKDSYISFSSSSQNWYNESFDIGLNVTFEVDVRTLKKALANRPGYTLEPYQFSKIHADELEVRLDLPGTAPVGGVKRFTNNIRIVPTPEIIKLAQFDQGIMPETNPDGTPLDAENYKKGMEIVRSYANDDIVVMEKVASFADREGFDVRLYPDRKEFLNPSGMFEKISNSKQGSNILNRLLRLIGRRGM